jgi:methane/ammonia monooxygenase subunit A
MTRATAVSNRYERIADWLILAILFFTIAASFKTTEVLTVGDWEMWVDWKDREWWPLLYPLLCITFPAVSQAVFWNTSGCGSEPRSRSSASCWRPGGRW